MPKTANRRALSFSTVDQVMPDVDRLLDLGYTPLGKWSLGQVCNHLTKGVTGTVEEDPSIKKAPWLLRRLVAPIVLNRVLKSGRMPEGLNGPPALMPNTGLDDRAEAEALRAALRLYSSHTGPVADHPFFGSLTRDQWDRLHRLHCAHHLSFLLPRESA